MSYSNIIKSEKDYKTVKEAADISTSILRQLRDNVKAGVKASDIAELASELCLKNKVKPAFLGVPGPKSDFPSSLCINVNNTILHGIPHSSIEFKEGDIVKVDFGVIHNGFYTDHCVTVAVGEISAEEKRLIETGRLCIDTAIKEAVVGNNVSDISRAMQTVCDIAGFNYIRSYCGHGIGKALWLEPEVLTYTYKGQEEIPLEEGMCLCIENQVVLGKESLYLDLDGWSLKTVDGSKGVMFEHMVIVRKGRPEILTLLD